MFYITFNYKLKKTHMFIWFFTERCLKYCSGELVKATFQNHDIVLKNIQD